MSILSFLRPFVRWSGLLAVALMATATLARAQSAADGFDPNVDGNVYAVAVQADGKILLAGGFASLQPNANGNPSARNNLARLNADGTVDPAFDPNVNGVVYALVVQRDGKIVIGGDFTTVGGTARLRLARLNADGSLDAGFTGGVMPAIAGLTQQVTAVALDANNKILVGGAFSSFVASPSVSVTTARVGLLRLNADGTLDTTFNPGLNNNVLAIAVDAAGKILIGGGFTKVGSTTRNRLARLNADGSLDGFFDPNANNTVNAITVQPDGKVLVGGNFTTLQPAGETTATTRDHFARLNADGTVDFAFNPDVSGAVAAISFQTDGGIVIGGTFNTIRSTGSNTIVTRLFVARFDGNGILDANFNPAPNYIVSALATQADGKIVLGGYFTQFQPVGTTYSTARNHVARVSATGAVDSSFDPGAGARVFATATQADGKIVVGGLFTNFSGVARTNLARISATGALDLAFAPSINGRVFAVAVQANGKVLIGGSFTMVGGVARNYVARLEADGSLDTGFDPNVNSQVAAFIVQSDQKIIMAGSFTTVQPNGATTSTARGFIARLNTDGTVDTNFYPNPNGIINALTTQSDGKIILGGNFSFLQPGATGTVYNRASLARINSDGTVDTNFAPIVNGAVNAVVVQSDGKLLVGGTFNSAFPSGSVGTTVSTVRLRLARFNTDGSIDTGYDPAANATVTNLALQSDGNVLVSGSFTSLQPNSGGVFTRNHLARLKTDGTLDLSFDPNPGALPSANVNAITVESGGKILIAGGFTSLQPNRAGAPILRNHVARLNADGSIDAAFDPSVGAQTSTQVSALAIDERGRLVVGGSFTGIGGATTANVARFSADGSPDVSFTTYTNGSVNAVAALPGGTTLVAGSFSSVIDLGANNLARISADGTLDVSFTGGTNGAVNALLVLPDGRILIGGAFTTVNGLSRGNLARLNMDGTLDTTFAASANGTVTTLSYQADGRILVGGSFTTMNNAARNRFARLSADGALDTSFNPNLGNTVSAVAVQSDGKILVAGAFTSVGGAARSFLGRLNADGTLDTAFAPTLNGAVNALALQTDGRVVAGGVFTTANNAARNRLARFAADGALDTTFDPSANGSVNTLALQADGRLMTGGTFTAMGSFTRFCLARLAPTTAASQLLSISTDLKTLTWTRTGSGPELAYVTIESSTDLTTWTSLGLAARVGGTANWRLAVSGLTTGSIVYYRARGYTAPTQFGSFGVVENVRFVLPGVTNLANSVDAGGAATAADGSVAQATTTANTATTAVSGTATVTSAVAANPANNGRLANLSARTRVSSTQPLIMGFYVAGTDTKRLLLRAVGPGLSAYGVSGTLATPRLQLKDGNGNVVLENSGWAGSATVAGTAVAVGAFPLVPVNPDAAVVADLAPGSYSMTITGGDGIVLAEIYDVRDGGSSRLTNVSARAGVESGAGVLTGGFVIAGDSARRVVLRGVGPGIATRGVADAITDPVISLFNSSGSVLGFNDNWDSTNGSAAELGQLAALKSLTAASGAFALDPSSKDAALVATLAPGAYSVQLGTASGATTGTALVEIYDAP